MDELHVEGAPEDDQKERLEDFLTELTLIGRKYGILLRDNTETVEIYDVKTDHLIGLGLTWFAPEGNENGIISYVPVDSILDGVWPVEGPSGPTQQRLVQNTFPIRS